MTRETTKPFVITLRSFERRRFTAAPALQGGHLSYYGRLSDKLGSGDTMTLDDAEMGELIRHMAYGGGNGGFQALLRQVFGRSVREMTGVN